MSIGWKKKLHSQCDSRLKFIARKRILLVSAKSQCVIVFSPSSASVIKIHCNWIICKLHEHFNWLKAYNIQLTLSLFHSIASSNNDGWLNKWSAVNMTWQWNGMGIMNYAICLESFFVVFFVSASFHAQNICLLTHSRQQMRVWVQNVNIWRWLSLLCVWITPPMLGEWDREGRFWEGNWNFNWLSVRRKRLVLNFRTN